MKTSHGVEYAAFWLFTKLAQLLPGSVADKLASGVGWLAYKLVKSRRLIAYDNIRRAYKGEMPEEEIDRITRIVFKNVARDMVEFARQPLIGKERVDDYVIDSTGVENIEKVLNDGHGVMLVTGHYGNGELLGGWLAKRFPIDFVVGVQHNKYVDDMFNSFREVFGAKIIPIGLAARHAIKSLKAGRIVILMSDQHSATGGTVVNFFDRPASTPKGPGAFAVKVGCPIVFAVMIRDRYDRFRAVINEPIYPPQSGDKEADINWMTQKYTSELEDLIRLHPEQWMWTHRRWKID